MPRDSDYGKEDVRMRKKLTHNLFLKILSLIFAFVLWLMVVIVTDPYKTVTISDIPISIKNETEITGQGIGQIYAIESPKDCTVSVKIYGQKSKVDKLTANDISAVVDFGAVSSVGAAYIEITEPEGVTIVSRTPNMMKIEVEALKEKTFDISLEVIGNPAAGYLINDARISPTSTKIIAPESLVDRIDKVEVQVDVSALSSDINSSRKVVLYDAAGKVINYDKNENITLSITDIQTYVETFMIKEVPIEISPSGEMQENHVLMSFSYEPDTIVLKGRKEDLSLVDSVVIPKESGLVKLWEVTETGDATFDISSFIPTGTYLMQEGSNIVTTHFEVKKIVEKTFSVAAGDIRISNVPVGMETEILDSLGLIEITVKGYEEDLDTLTLDSISPYISLVGAKEGNADYKVRVRSSDEFELVGEPVVNITLKPIIEETVDTPITDPVINEEISEENN